MNLSALKKGGTVFPVEISLNYFEIDNEMFAMALITDISQRKEAQEELQELKNNLEKTVEERTLKMKENELLYSTIARHFPNGTMNVFDRNLKYVFVEGQELFKLGITSKQLVGTKYISRLPKEVRNLVEQELNEVFETKSEKTFELNVYKGTYHLSAVPLKNEQNEVDRILVVEQNITTRKKAEKDMAIALEKEKMLSDLKSRFVSMASHEFRTPLTTILSSANLISKYEKTDQQPKRTKHTDRIISSVRHLTGILNDFLSLSKLEEGKINSHTTEFNVYETALQIAEEMQEIAKEGQTVRYQHTGENHLVVMDLNHFKNICANLISNAIKYSSIGKKILFIIHTTPDRLIITVEDEGIGIPKNEQKNMFERFFRANNVTNIEGTGLGLNIVKKYIELTGGTISFESEYEKGTTFTVNIPQ